MLALAEQRRIGGGKATAAVRRLELRAHRTKAGVERAYGQAVRLLP